MSLRASWRCLGFLASLYQCVGDHDDYPHGTEGEAKQAADCAASLGVAKRGCKKPAY